MSHETDKSNDVVSTLFSGVTDRRLSHTAYPNPIWADRRRQRTPRALSTFAEHLAKGPGAWFAHTVDYAELVLDYVRLLVWPALVVFIAIRFRRGIGEFARRIAGESQEISASGFGLGITAKFVQEKLETLAEQSETAAPGELKASVQRVAKELSHDQFRALTASFTRLSPAQRRQVVAELARVAESMELDEILSFARSPHDGERVGAAVGLSVLLQRSDEAVDDPLVLKTIREMLNDRSSFVRYRAIEALLAKPALIALFENELRSLSTRSERYPQVREMANRALEQLAV